MIGYKLTIEQKEAIQGVEFSEATIFNCVQDINGVWFLFLSEQDKNNLPSEYAYLLNLPQEEFIPPIPPIDEQ
tara:strand:+ start:299 stop:517 length:219 start_codon:yes stop_codon:yes gene_type:complete